MKKILFILALLLASGAFTGCGSDDPIPTPNPNGGGGGGGSTNPDNGGSGGGGGTNPDDGGSGGGGGTNPGDGGSGGGGGTNPDDGGSGGGAETKPNWYVTSTTQYENTMSVWINVSAGSKKDALAVFSGDECRGVGEIVTDMGNYQLWCVLVYGNDEKNSNLTVKYWNDSESKTYSSAESFPFTADGQYGTADNPKSLNFK